MLSIVVVADGLLAGGLLEQLGCLGLLYIRRAPLCVGAGACDGDPLSDLLRCFCLMRLDVGWFWRDSLRSVYKEHESFRISVGRMYSSEQAAAAAAAAAGNTNSIQHEI